MQSKSKTDFYNNPLLKKLHENSMTDCYMSGWKQHTPMLHLRFVFVPSIQCKHVQQKQVLLLNLLLKLVSFHRGTRTYIHMHPYIHTHMHTHTHNN